MFAHIENVDSLSTATFMFVIVLRVIILLRCANDGCTPIDRSHN